MVLLMPYDPALEAYKDFGHFGGVTGQLCIQSRSFHKEVTKFS